MNKYLMNKSTLLAIFLTQFFMGSTQAGPKINPDAGPAPKTIIFSLPESAFDDTTEGITREELDSLAQKLESESWKVTDSKLGRVTIKCKYPSSQIQVYAYPMAADTMLLTQVINEKSTVCNTWVHKANTPTAVSKRLLPDVSINEFYSEDGKFANPDAYKGNVILSVQEDGVVVYSVSSWMNKDLDEKPKAYAITAVWDGSKFRLNKKRLELNN